MVRECSCTDSHDFPNTIKKPATSAGFYFF
ncbi:hypothetical protein D041_1228A, partial [Vibrio parahaemolyticus EKP-008]